MEMEVEEMKTKLNGIEGGVAENGVWTLEKMKHE
jgi:hypothetical protein